MIEDCRRKLFAAGFMGAYSFPAAAPLALLSASFSREELRQTAHEIRKISLKNKGKITAAGIDQAVCSENMAFCGPLLDIPQALSTLSNKKTLCTFPKAVLCAAIGSKDEQITLPELPTFSFSAAMVANLVIRPLKNGVSPYSLEWRLGPGCWLPRIRSEQRDFC
jgi:hypothetical protein